MYDLDTYFLTLWIIKLLCSISSWEEGGFALGVKKHYWSSGIESLYLKLLWAQSFNTSDTYSIMLEKGNTDVQVLFLSRTIFGSGSIIRRTHAMIFCFKGEKVSKCVKVFLNWILSGVANRQYVIYGFFWWKFIGINQFTYLGYLVGGRFQRIIVIFRSTYF